MHPSARVRLHALLEDVVFLHFLADPRALRPLLPRGVELDRPLGEAWITLGVLRSRGPAPLPPPLLGGLPRSRQLWLRTCVIAAGEPALLVLDDAVSSRALAASARLLGLHPRRAPLSLARAGDRIEIAAGASACGPTEVRSLRLVARARGAAMPAHLDPIAHRLLERRLLVGARDGALIRVEHAPWLVEPLAIEQLELGADLLPPSTRLGAAHVAASGALVLLPLGDGASEASSPLASPLPA